ncbi:MAG: lamin tail domain-containing protein [Bacteroidetes bacterium]|nr:lamin tail domain-containing protein [Bacteroidota bacterium]
MIPNGPIGTPLEIAIIDSLGNTIGSVATVTTVTNVGTAGQFNYQTVELNIFVPYSTIPYAMRPLANPNLSVHQNATVAASFPWQVAGEINILAYGNMPPAASFFGSTTFGFFYNWQVMHGCFGASCEATYQVDTPPALSITAGGSTTFCDSGSVSLDAIVSSDPSYVNFSWSPATGLSSTTGGVVTANVSTTTTYTVTADDGIVGGCANTATITITVNTAPFASVGSIPDTVCTTEPFQINGTGGSASFKTIGTTVNPGQTSGWPFNGANLGQRMQITVSAAELNAAGLFGPSFINSLGFQLSSKLSSAPYNGFTVNIDTLPTGTTCFSSANYLTMPIGSEVFNGNYSTVAPSLANGGWNDIVFTTPYAWDGVHNIVIQTCFANTTTTFFDQVYTTQTPGCFTTNAVNAAACGTTLGANLDLRPNVRFQGGLVNYAWTPATELDNAAIASPLFTQSLGQGPRQYVLTVTDPSNGCVATDTANFYVSPTPVAPTVAFAGDSTACGSNSIDFIGAFTTGSIQWQTSLDGINFTDIAGETSTSLSYAPGQSVYVRLKAYCADTSYSNVLTVQVFNPTIVNTENDTVCGQGNVSLIAQSNPGYFVQWFNDQNAGQLLTNGDTLNTFVTATDTFWVSATTDTNVVGAGACPKFTDIIQFQGGTGSGVLPGFVSAGANDYVEISNTGSTAMDLSGFVFQRLNTAALSFTFPSGSIVAPGGTFILAAGVDPGGFPPIAGQYDYMGGFSDATSSASLVGYVLSAPNGNIVDVVTTNGFNPVGVGTPAVGAADWTGAIASSSGNAGVTRQGATDSNDAADWSITSVVPSTPGAYNAGLSISSGSCGACASSPRVPVIAVVNPAPPVTVSPATATICEGGSVQIDVTAGSLDYTNFDWTPVTGLDVTSGLTVMASPSVTTTYTVTATGNIDGCQNSATSIVTVNPAPVFSLSPSSQNLCNGDTANVSVTVTSPIPSDYNVTSIVFAPETPSGIVTVLADAGVAVVPQTIASLDDGTWEGIPLPAGFAFSYYGSPQTQFNVSTNGFVTLGATLGTAGCCSGQIMPNVSTPNNLLALSHEDFNMTSGTIDYFTNGVAPNRKFVIRFTNAPRFGGTGAPTTGQIVLVETLNTIEYHVTSVTTASGDATTMGIENATGTLATVVPGRNSSSPWTATNEGWLFQLPLAATIQWAGQGIIGSSTGTSIQALPSTSGYYTCTVTNPLTGCTKVDSVAVNFNVSPAPQIVESDTTLCNPDQIYIHVADVGAYSVGYPLVTTFTWSWIVVPIVDLDSISSNNGSSYSVIVTLPSGCSASSDTITVLTKSVAVVEVINNATCSGGGSIEVTVTSGLPNYNYVWSTDFAQTNIVRNVTKVDNQDTLGNIAAGTYYLQVYDEAGSPASCNSGVLTYVVGGAAQIDASVTPTDITCNGLANGTADVTWTGGVAPFSITWSDGNSANTTPRGISSAGNYSVIVSDLSGCADTVAFVIAEPLPVSVTFTSTPESFPGALDGTVTAIPAGGTPGYTLLWADEFFSPAGSGNPLTGLAAGLYYGLVTDANGCDNSATVLGDSIRVDVISNATFNVTVFTEGFFDGVSGMVPVLLNSGVGLSATECDTIFVELRDQLSPTTVIASGSAVMNTNGQATFTFPGAVIGQNGYIAVFHRNAVQTWSDVITFAGITNYNFTTAASQAFGSNQVQVAPGIFAMYSGDLGPLQDEFIDILDQGVIDNDIFNFAGGYVYSDLNGDGFVDIVDQSIVDNNIFNFIGSIHP